MCVCRGAPIHASSNTGQGAFVTQRHRDGSESLSHTLGEALLRGVRDCLRGVAQRYVGVFGHGRRTFPCHGVLAQTSRADVFTMYGPHSFGVHILTPGRANPVHHMFLLRLVTRKAPRNWLVTLFWSNSRTEYGWTGPGRALNVPPCCSIRKALDTPGGSIV